MAIERDETYWLKAANTMLEAQVQGLFYELHVREIRLKEQDQYIAQLEQQIKELKEKAVDPGEPEPQTPAWVKANVPTRSRKKPGRKVGHEPAFRPVPTKIDHHLQVPLVTDGAKTLARWQVPGPDPPDACQSARARG